MSKAIWLLTLKGTANLWLLITATFIILGGWNEGLYAFIIPSVIQHIVANLFLSKEKKPIFIGELKALIYTLTVIFFGLFILGISGIAFYFLMPSLNLNRTFSSITIFEFLSVFVMTVSTLFLIAYLVKLNKKVEQKIEEWAMEYYGL
jgi:hypothetical protein